MVTQRQLSRALPYPSASLPSLRYSSFCRCTIDESAGSARREQGAGSPVDVQILGVVSGAGPIAPQEEEEFLADSDFDQDQRAGEGGADWHWRVCIDYLRGVQYSAPD